MPRKKTKPPDMAGANLLRAQTGLPTFTENEMGMIVNSQKTQFSRFLQWFKTSKHKSPEEMYCFIMYDIENNKIRRILAKYLEKKGCIRIQKSVFFAKIHRRLYREISEIAADLQQCYENEDTIIMLPVGEDMLNTMRCIGKNFDLELLTQTKHTLIF